MDWLDHHGIANHRLCVFYRYDNETIDHLMVGCAITGQFWACFMQQVGFHQYIPFEQSSLENFWLHARQLVSATSRKGLESCIILIAWMIWKERNSRVFDKVASPLESILHKMFNKLQLWRESRIQCLPSYSLFE